MHALIHEPTGRGSILEDRRPTGARDQGSAIPKIGNGGAVVRVHFRIEARHKWCVSRVAIDVQGSGRYTRHSVFLQSDLKQSHVIASRPWLPEFGHIGAGHDGDRRSRPADSGN